MLPPLETERLLLKEIFAEDQSFVFEGLSHPDVIRHYGVSFSTYEATVEQMDWYRKMVLFDWGMAWKMVEKESGEKIGVITVYHYKQARRKAEVGFWLLPAFWNKGFASEALIAVAQFWFRERGLHRLEAFVEEGNDGSSKVLTKAAFQYEGTMRECEIKNGHFISLHVYALLAPGG